MSAAQEIGGGRALAPRCSTSVLPELAGKSGRTIFAFLSWIATRVPPSADAGRSASGILPKNSSWPVVNAFIVHRANFFWGSDRFTSSIAPLPSFADRDSGAVEWRMIGQSMPETFST